MQETFMPLAEAARFVRLSRSRLYELYESGKVTGRQVDGKILFQMSDLERAIAPRITKPKGQR
jgi:hypothetical protein